jgi:hypothetical protein
MNENKKRTAPKKNTPPKKGKKGLIIIIILVLIIGGIIAVYTLNLFDFREGVMMPYLRNMPLVGGFFPLPEEADETIPLEQRPPHELVRIIREQETQIEELETRIQSFLTQARSDALRIARLLPFYEHWIEYQRVSAEFNAMIARGDPEAYLHFIQYIMPEFYEQLARDAMQLHLYEESVTTIVRTLGNMQERNAADVLVDLRTTDIILLINVLNAMGNALRGAILNEMDPIIASAMLRLISIPEPTLSQLAPSLFTPELPETIQIIPEEDEIDEEDENGNDETTDE